MSLTTSYTYRHTHGPTAVSALHRVWQSHALAWLLRNGHSPSGATAVTLCVLKVVIPLQTHKTHKQFNTCTQKNSLLYIQTLIATLFWPKWPEKQRFCITGCGQ